MVRDWRFGVALAAVLLTHAPSAAAEDTCPGTSPVIEARIEDDAPIDRERLLRLLRIELAARGLQLCTNAGERRPVAVVRLAPHESDVTLTIEVRDRITKKLLQRDVPVGAYPADARPLLVAVAMDELLRASWAELAMADAPPPDEPPPKQVTDAVHDGIAPAPAAGPRVRLGARAAVEHFADGATLLGGDVVAGVWLLPRLSVLLALELRGAPTSESANGSVSPSMLAGSLGVAFTLTPPRAMAGLDLAAHVAAARVSFGATAASGARALPQSEGTVLFDLGIEGWLALGRWVRIVADLAWVQPLRPVRALDGATTVVGVGGPGLGGGLGACATF